jgi:hypothetical protein
MVLSHEGLTAYRGDRPIGCIPAEAFLEVIHSEGPSGSELRLRYDRSVMPELPPAIRKYCELKGMPPEEVHRALHGVSAPDIIPLSSVYSLGLDKLFQIRQLVETGRLGTWRQS